MTQRRSALRQRWALLSSTIPEGGTVPQLPTPVVAPSGPARSKKSKSDNPQQNGARLLPAIAGMSDKNIEVGHARQERRGQVTRQARI